MISKAHPAAISIDALLAQCEVRRQRRSGPGGQHRNKVETAIVLVHEPSGIRAEATERRSQAANLKVAIQRLRVRLAIEVRQPIASRSKLWQSRVSSGQITVSAGHEAFPTLLAEALDAIAECEFDCKGAAALLDCSSSQLVKLLKLEPDALSHVNEQRKHRELVKLR